MLPRPIPEQIWDLPAAWRDRPLYTASAGTLTYGGLRNEMLRAAAWLQSRHGITAGDRVAICLPKSLEAVILIYGIMAAGAAYVPLQFQGPAERLRRVLGSTAPRRLLTTQAMVRHFVGATETPPIEVVATAPDGQGLEPNLGDAEPLARPVPVTSDHLAAIYFTSGSTGEPKGVMWSHRTMAAGSASLPNWAGMHAEDRLISVAALNYTASADMFYPLMVGARSHLLTEREFMAPELVSASMEREGTTLWTATATALRLLVEGGRLDQRDLRTLRHVNFYGERLPASILRKAMHLMPAAEFCNFYGASEAFTIMAYRVPRPLPNDLTDLPLGHVTGVYQQSLRDEDGNEVPTGTIGEVCLVGPAVMAGYWNDPALTASRRLAGISDSFRTGDLVRCDPEGVHHLVGRHDHVVKLRGHRFDLGEIEAALKRHPEVRDAVACVVGEDGGCAHAAILATPRDGLLRDVAELCARHLPVFAQPVRIIAMGQFPRLPSGKIDRRTVARDASGLP